LDADSQERTLNDLLRLERGHWLELGLEEAFTALGLKFLTQLRISLDHENVPLKGHLDIVLPSEDGRSLTVLELKSTAKLREQVYQSHEAQLYGQISLLRALWRRPAFSIGDQDQAMTFQELVRSRLGLSLPNSAGSVSIKGFVLVVSPEAAHPFGPYEPNDAVLETVLKTGTLLWQHLTAIRAGRETLDDVPHCSGFQPLCGYCTHNRDCPKFLGDYRPELEPELEILTELKETRNDLEAEIKEREDQLKALAGLLGPPGQWINGHKHRFRVSSQAGKVTLDQNLLKAGLSQVGRLDENELALLLASAQKTGRPFDRLQVSTIN
jgi:hypothetical protein